MRVLPALLMLGACSAGNDAPAANQAAAQSQRATFDLATPLFNVSLGVPATAMNAGDFDMNGVTLPPGSTIRSVNVQAEAAPGQPTLTLRFASPEPPAKVRDWLLPRLRDAGYLLEPRGDGLAGTTDDGKPFRLTLAGEGGGSLGTIELVD